MIDGQLGLLKAALYKVLVMRCNLLQLHCNVQQRIIPAPKCLQASALSPCPRTFDIS